MASAPDDGIASLNGLVPPRGYPVIGDDREAARNLTMPVDPELQRAFLTDRQRLVLNRTPPTFGPSSVLKQLGIESTGKITLPEKPIPGGVGFGAFYTSGFKSYFEEGTAIYWEIVTPQLAGGTVSHYLYLTAMNRAAFGVEALIAYYSQNTPNFLVFDWARPAANRWQLNIPFHDLTPYLHSTTIGAQHYSVLPLMNLTFQSAYGAWVNQVQLLSNVTNSWRVVYQYNYAATLDQQRAGWVGYWGPIVETFESSYSGTNLMGAFNTQLARAVQGQWQTWSQLKDEDSDMRQDNKGFRFNFLDPNWSWVVSS